MQHKHIIFFIFTFFTFASLVPYYRHGTIYITTDYAASDYYRTKTHQFLKHLKVKNPEQVCIRLIVGYPIFLSDKESSPPHRLGSANQDGIWLNENTLEKESLETRLFVIAHEAAHYALEHSQNLAKLDTRFNRLKYFVTTIIATVSIFNKNETDIEKKLSFISKQNKQLKLLVKGMQTMLFSALSYFGFSYLQKKEITSFRLKNEKEADKIATYLLCDLGYESLIQKGIESLHAEIIAGHGEWTDGEHPTIKQRYEYLQKYLKRWKTKYASRSNAAYIKI